VDGVSDSLLVAGSEAVEDGGAVKEDGSVEAYALLQGEGWSDRHSKGSGEGGEVKMVLLE